MINYYLKETFFIINKSIIAGKKETKAKEKKHKNKTGKKVKEKKEEKEDKEEKPEHIQFEDTPQILPAEPLLQVCFFCYIFI